MNKKGILNIFYDKSMEFGQKMIDDLIDRSKGVANNIPIKSWNNDIRLITTFYYDGDGKSQMDNFRIDLHTGASLRDVESRLLKIKYSIVVNIDFSGVIDNKLVDNYGFYLIIKEWAKSWDFANGDRSREHDRFSIQGITKEKTIDFLSAIKKVNENNLPKNKISNYKDYSILCSSKIKNIDK